MNKIQKFMARVFMGSSWDDYIRAFLRGDDVQDIPGNTYVDTETAMKYSAVFACVRVLSETLASMPAMLYRKKKDGDREARNDLAVYDILHNAPNSEMAPFNFKEACMTAINLGGNAVCERLVNQYGDLVGLYPYPWTMVQIARERGTGQLQYKIRDSRSGMAAEKTLSREQVFHVAGPSFDGVVGLTPIEYLASAIRLGLSYERFGVNFYKNGANASGVFSFPNSLKAETYRRLKEDLTKSYTGLANTGKPILLEEGGDFKQLTIKPADAQLIENKRFQIEDVARIYRVPLHLIQELSKSTNNNIEHQSLEFQIFTMLPWAQRWEQNINHQLLTRKDRLAGYYVELNMASMLRGDLKSRYDAYATGIQWGILSINDCLKLENMNSIPDGDRRIQPLNMISIAKADEYYTKQTDQAKAMAEKLINIIDRTK